jgi:hypothetical protein
MSGRGKRRTAILPPGAFESISKTANHELYAEAIRAMPLQREGRVEILQIKSAPAEERDGVHLSDAGHRHGAFLIGVGLSPGLSEFSRVLGTGLDRAENADLKQLLALIRAKNRVWFNYWRPQNWAFLNGDRINQPSSRDHLDPSKRWFPDEIEQFIPLIEAKEKEIDALAQKLAKP